MVRTRAVMRSDASWSNYGVPFLLNQGIVVQNGSRLTLTAGTELRFGFGQRIRVSTNSEEGTLVAVGTPEAPIRMVPNGGSGNWDGLLLDSNLGPATVVRHVRVEDFSGTQAGGVRVDNPVSGAVGRPIIEDCLIQSAAPDAVGIHLSGSAEVSSFENNVLDVPRFAVDAPLSGFDDVLGASNVYEAPLQVRAGSTTGIDMVWVEPEASDTSTQPIRPTGNLSVLDGSLRIGEGTQVQMPLNAQLAILESQLVVEGSETDPVVFAPAPGAAYWSRILLRGGNASGPSRINYAVLDTAGANPALGADPGRTALRVEASGASTAIPQISNTTITGSNGYGMTFSDLEHCNGLCDDNTVVGSRFSALRMHANYIGRFGDGNALAGNDTSSTLGHEGVWVVDDRVDVSATWPLVDVPYVIQGNVDVRESSPLDPIPVLTLLPGTELRFASERRLRVGENGDGILDAQGTEADPIVFTTVDSTTPVFWRGLAFGQGSDGSILDRFTVSYGGSVTNTGNLNFLSGSLVTVGAGALTDGNQFAGVISSGAAPSFVGPQSERVYVGNTSNCIRDVAAGTCEPL